MAAFEVLLSPPPRSPLPELFDGPEDGPDPSSAAPGIAGGSAAVTPFQVVQAENGSLADHAIPDETNGNVLREANQDKSALSHKQDNISSMIQALEDDGFIPLDELDATLKRCDSSIDLSFPLLLLGTKYNNVVLEKKTKEESVTSKIETLTKKYTELWAERKRLYNEVIEMKGNIRVFCRCRPMSSEEHSKGYSSVFELDPSQDAELHIVTSENTRKQFKFDHVFGPHGTQEAVFAETESMVKSVLDGYNVCIFAYGQTGTGKTFTMEGTPENRGVNYRTLEELFRVSEERSSLMRYEFFVSALEVYNERIRDLLPENPNCPSKKLEVKQAAEGTQEVPGLVEARAYTIDGVWELLQASAKNRSVGSTNANELSSRSHSLVRVTVRGENLMNGVRTRSHLWLVDLAGSERVGKIEVEGERLKESQFINKSLSALGDVIAALASKNPHIPYRNSKLTHLLQSSLGGDCKTLMIVQISPSSADVGETLCSLNFATRVRGIEQGPARKQADPAESFKLKQMAEKLRQEERERVRLNENLQLMHIKYASRETQLMQLKEKVRDLENQLGQERKVKHQQHQQQQEEGINRFHPSKPPLPPAYQRRQPLGRISANLPPAPAPRPRKSVGDWLPSVPEAAAAAHDKENNKPKLQARRILLPPATRAPTGAGGAAQPRRRASVAATPARTALNRVEAPSSILRIIRRRSSVMALRNDFSSPPPQGQGQWRASRIPVVQSPRGGGKISFSVQKRLVVGSPMMMKSLAFRESGAVAPTTAAAAGRAKEMAGRFGSAQRIPLPGNRRRSSAV